MNYAPDLRLQRTAEGLCTLPLRVLFELLAERRRIHTIGNDIADRAEAFASLDADILRAIGGDRFPVQVRRVA